LALLTYILDCSF